MNVYQISQSWKQYDNYLVDSSYSAQFLVQLLNTMVWGIWLLSAVCVCVELTVVTVLPDPCIIPGQSVCEREVSSELQLCK